MSQEEDAAKPDASCGPETRARRQFQPFTPEELAALLPLKPPPPPPAFFPGDDDASDDIEKLLRPPDPAADARAADPGLRVLAPFPGLALFTRIQGSLVPLTAFSVPMFWLCAAGVAAGLAVALVFLAPAGIARQNLAIGFVFPVVHMLLGGVFNAQLAVGRGFTWQAALCWPRSRTLVQARLAFARAGFFADRLAGFHRWIALSGAGSGDDEAPGDCEPDFVRHLDRDPMCPCPRKSCSGTLPRNALTQRVLLVGSHTLLFMFCFLSILWTPIVTLAGGTWSNAWSGTVVTLGLCATVPLVLCRFPLLVVTSSGMLATSRLRHRAIALCLECTLRSCADVLRGGPGMDGADEYAQLGPRIWGQVRASVSLVSLQPRNIARSIPLLLVYGVANAMVGRCVPAWIVVYLAWYLLTLFHELWVATLINAEATDSASQYAAAASTLKRLLLAAHPASGPTAPSGAVDHVRAHAAALETLAGSAAEGGRKARILGFEITFGSIRTLYATIATVAFAVWGLLRGLGVGVQMESFCGV